MKKVLTTAIICITLAVCTFMLTCMPAGADALKGDMDGNGTVNITDVLLLLKQVTAPAPTATPTPTPTNTPTPTPTNTPTPTPTNTPTPTPTNTPTPTPTATPTPAPSLYFTEGTGSQADPYVISTSNELYKMAELVNSGDKNANNEYYRDLAYKLGANISLNDETFEFMADTGLVKVTDGTNIAYLGTGILGNTNGENTVFDTVASTAGTWYSSDSSTDMGEYAGILNEWISIGNSTNDFWGYFDGSNYTVNGIYINTTEDYQGLFGYSNGRVNNVKVVTSCIIGKNYVGGIAGLLYSDTASNNCTNSGIVIGTGDRIGGIAGYTQNSINNCHNSGTVMGTGAYIGGIIGDFNARSIKGCTNNGDILGTNKLGGIAGYSVGAISDCTNNGIIIGTGDNIGGIVGETSGGSFVDCTNIGAINGDSYVGGIAGYCYKITLTGCNNSGTTNGDSYVGGMAGFCYGTSTITDCHNSGAVNGTRYGAGIVGYCYDSSASISDCSNSGTINVENYTGGIVGSSTTAQINDCINIGSVSGHYCVGGIIGESDSDTISSCHNKGNVIASGNVGGYQSVGGITGSCKRNSAVIQCVNSGSIIGSTSAVGGIAGYLGYGCTMSDCYNTGNVSGKSEVGGIVGCCSATAKYHITVDRCYTVGIVTRNNSDRDCAIGWIDTGYTHHGVSINYVYVLDTSLSNDIIEGGTLVTEDQMQLKSTFDGFDFDTVWTMDGNASYPYPELFIVDYSDSTVPVIPTSTPTPTATPIPTATPTPSTNSWNGTVAMGFESGSGTEKNPYIISSGAQLALLAKLTNEATTDSDGVLYSTKSYKLGADIVLNDDSFEYMQDTGLVKITDGTNVGYVGTYAGTLTSWTPIGTGYTAVPYEINDSSAFNLAKQKYGTLYYVNNSGAYSATSYQSAHSQYYYRACFNGSFDGNGFTISRLFINTNEDYQGIFGYVADGIISDVTLENSYICGNKSIGGIVGCGYPAITVSGCTNSATVIGSSDHVGGIIGSCSDGNIKKCTNSGSISGNSDIAGIAGYCYNNTVISICENIGKVSGSKYVGGIAGDCWAGTIVSFCANSGDVSADERVGGIAGNCACTSVTNCANSGDVSGYSSVGSVAGYCSGTSGSKTTFEKCYSVGAVKVNGTLKDIAVGTISSSYDNYVSVKYTYILDTSATNSITNGGTLLTDAQMRDQFCFGGFDFDTIWTMDGKASYPYPELCMLLQ